MKKSNTKVDKKGKVPPAKIKDKGAGSSNKPKRQLKD